MDAGSKAGMTKAEVIPKADMTQAEVIPKADMTQVEVIPKADMTQVEVIPKAGMTKAEVVTQAMAIPAQSRNLVIAGSDPQSMPKRSQSKPYVKGTVYLIRLWRIKYTVPGFPLVSSA